MKLHSDTRFVFVQWLDYMGTIRSRIYPVLQFNKLIDSGTRIPIAQGNTGTLQNDTVTPVVNSTGQIYVEPDLESLRPAWQSPMPAATVMSCWCDANGLPIKDCARCQLKTSLQELSSEHSAHLLLGFEIECVFFRRNPENPTDPYAPLTTTHAWGSMTPDQWTNALPILLEISEALAAIGMPLQYMHPESFPTYEFVLPPLPPVQAIDTLYQTRQVLANIAESHGLRVTLHPKPLPISGSGAHAHVSLNSTSLSAEVLNEKDSQFWAGVLAHLEAICAFTLPEKESYERVTEDHWAGGVWIAWGTQNREVPLRKSEERRWEIRCLDGFANMYLVLGAVVAAGLLGLREGMKLSIKDCPCTFLASFFISLFVFKSEGNFANER
jgi:glutamine synthetase